MGYTGNQSLEALGAETAASPPVETARMTALETPEAELPQRLDAAERHRVLVEWNATEADYPHDRCVHELIEAQAARTPDARKPQSIARPSLASG